MDPELYLAAARGDETVFKSFSSDALLKETPENYSVLHVATLHKQQRIVENILLSHGPLVYHKNSVGDTPLHVAARMGSPEIAKLLIDHGKIGIVSSQKKVLKLIQPPNLIKMVNLNKDSVLHDAVRNGHLSVVELLIEEDCELSLVTNIAGESPLFLAVERNMFEIAKHLLDNTEKCSLAGRDGVNALHAAVVHLHNYLARSDNQDVKFVHLSTDADTSSSGNYPELHGEDSAAVNSNCNYTKLHGIVKDMVRNCPTAVGEADNFGWTPLHYAARYGVEEVIELFLTNAKSSAYKKDMAGMSAFHLASKKGEVGIMAKLSTLCPDICGMLTSNGQTALHVAVKSEKNKAVEYLLKALGSDDVLNKQDKDGNTHLHLAAVLED